MRQIILDTETTGLEPSQGHRIIEIACVEMINRRLSGRYWHAYINPQRDIDEGAMAVHGLTPDFLADKPVFADVVGEFSDFVRDSELIIHNAPFDLGFLNAELERMRLGRMDQLVGGVIDTLKMARDQFPGKRNSLDALCDRFVIDRSGRTLHGALIDCELLGDVYLALTRGQDSLLIDLAAPSASENLANIARRAARKPLIVARVTPEEEALHQAYLDEVEKAAKKPSLWRVLEAAAAESPTA